MRTSSDETIAIAAAGLGKEYRLQRGRPRDNNIRDALMSSLRSMAKGGWAAQRSRFWALKDVSFEIRQGENVGILGLNGAGKSTLLKVLSRVTDPTTGSARLHGRLGSLLEVGTGFHGELSGRENVFLYGAILGMSRAETARKFDDIVAFAEIESFIDTPVKRYSSGMYVRLAFSVAAHLEPDILLLDEVLAVGDLPFQRRCMEFTKDLQKRQATILFVSHNMFSIKTMCERVIYLRQGRVEFDGPVDQGIALYEADCRLSPAAWAAAETAERLVEITDVDLMNARGERQGVFDHGERMRLRLRYRINGSEVRQPNFLVSFIRSDGVACCCYSTELDGVSIDVSERTGTLELLTPPLSLVSELYKIEILVREHGFRQLLCAQTGASFHVRDPLLDLHFGVFHEPGKWTVRDQRISATTLEQMGAAQ